MGRWSLFALLAWSITAIACEGRRLRPRVMVAASFEQAATRVIGDAAIVVPAASSSQARRIVAGSPADIFISANREWIDYVARHGLIVPGSRQRLVSNEIVLVTPGSRPRDFDLKTFRGKIAMGDPSHVPAGTYGRRALQAAGVWDRLASSIVPTSDVRHALALVARDEVDLAVVYLTDVKLSRKVSVVHRFPETRLSVVYEIALIRGGDPALLKRLTDPSAQRIYRELGFGPMR